MIRYLTLDEVLELHRLALQQSGGLQGVRDLGGLDSALTQPRMAFGGQDLYPSLAEKAAARGFSLVCNHPFVDGNKRVGHAALETFLVLNGWDMKKHKGTRSIREAMPKLIREIPGNHKPRSILEDPKNEVDIKLDRVND